MSDTEFQKLSKQMLEILKACEDSPSYENRPQITSPDLTYTTLLAKYPFLKNGGTKEHFFALYLDGRRRLLFIENISIGTATATLVHPREVFSPALKSEIPVTSIILAHNHPSGEAIPSREDRMLTERLVQAGQLLAINVDDHIIIGDNNYVSLRQMDIIFL
jgi:DNA repair protein RadC